MNRNVTKTVTHHILPCLGLLIVDASAQKEHMDYGRHNDRPFFNVCRECQQLIDKCLIEFEQKFPDEDA